VAAAFKEEEDDDDDDDEEGRLMMSDEQAGLTQRLLSWSETVFKDEGRSWIDSYNRAC